MSYNKLKGLAAAFAATLLWGGFYPVSRWLNSGTGDAPDGLTASLARFFIASLALSPALFDREACAKLRQNWRRDLPLFALLAAVGIVGQGVLVLLSTRYTTSARSSLMANTAPIFTVLLSWWIAREALTGRKVAGMILGALGIGVMFMLRGQDDYSGGAATWAGDLLAVGAGACWALYTVLGSGPSSRCGAFFCTECTFVIGTLMLLPLSAIWGQLPQLATYSKAAWLGISYLSLLAGALGFSLWYVALKYLAPGELGAFGYLTPVVSATLAYLCFNERLGWGFLLALALILGGVALMMEKKAANDSNRHDDGGRGAESDWR